MGMNGCNILTMTNFLDSHLFQRVPGNNDNGVQYLLPLPESGLEKCEVPEADNQNGLIKKENWNEHSRVVIECTCLKYSPGFRSQFKRRSLIP